MHADIAPVAFNFWRWVVAAVVLTPFAARSVLRYHQEIIQEWRALAILGLLGISGYNTLSYMALSETNAFNAAVMMSAVPILIPVIDFLVNRVRIHGLQGAGIFISLCGVVIILFEGSMSRIAAFEVGKGEAWMVLAVTVWASYSVALRHRPKSIPPQAFLVVIIWLGLIFLLPVFAWELSLVGNIAPTPTTLATLAYVGVFASLLSYIFWNKGVAEVGPTRAGLFSHLMPVFSAILAYVFLGENIALYHMVGLVFILCGVFVTTRYHIA